MSRPTRFLSNPAAYVIPDPSPVEPTPPPTPAPVPIEPTPTPVPAPAEVEATVAPAPAPIALDPIDVAPARKPRAKKLPAAPAALPAVAE